MWPKFRCPSWLYVKAEKHLGFPAIRRPRPKLGGGPLSQSSLPPRNEEDNEDDNNDNYHKNNYNDNDNNNSITKIIIIIITKIKQQHD